MKLTNLAVKNFRSIEDLSLSFPAFYTAISGRNNSGKSNILRVLKALFQPEQRFQFQESELRHSGNFPVWKSKDSGESISLTIELKIDKVRDSSVFKLAKEFFTLADDLSEMLLSISLEYLKDKDQPEVVVRHAAETLDSYKSKAMLKTVRSSGAFQFHDSTELDNPFESSSSMMDLIGQIAKEDREKLVKERDKLSKTITGVAKKHQKGISDLLGRLEDKYIVGLSAPKLNVDFLPINITLGDKHSNVSLDDWGSGTQNRTHILMALFKASRLSVSADEDTKIAPILVIEEPESFLHPSAQAEFGRLVQDLCEEFQIQVLVATHSPYFLSQQRPDSNILICRTPQNGRLGPTKKVEVSEENWMEPFALNLGLANPEFEPWRDVFFSRTDQILLVEGTTDKEYFEMLRSDEHGDLKLDFKGEVFSYDGKDQIKNGVLLKFIKGRYHKFFVLFDLDADQQHQKLFTSLEMERNKHFCAVGLSGSGKNNIEGLLPDSVVSAVLAANPDLVRQALGGSADEARSAKFSLKRLQLEEFKRQAVPGQEFYGEFYKLAKIINKAMN